MKKKNGNGADADMTAKEFYGGFCPLDLVESYLTRFVAYPSQHAIVAHVLWIAHTHCIYSFDTTPRLAFMSEEKASGKTRALEVTALFVPTPILSISASPAVIVRLINNDLKPTILYDEIDGVFGNAKAQEANMDLRSILNGGYRRGAKVHRCVTGNKGPVGIEELDAFAPVAVAGLATLPDTLASRSIFIHMKRRAPDEVVEGFRHKLHAAQAEPIADSLAEWCAGLDLEGFEPVMPEGIEDRNADCWEPLLLIADAAGDDADETVTAGTELLAHCRDAFGALDRLWTTELCDRLCIRDESPWKELRNGQGINDRMLAKRLRGYGIKSLSVRIDDHHRKGYMAEDFKDAWRRYCGDRDKRDKRDIIDNENNYVPVVPAVPDIAEDEAPEPGSFEPDWRET